MHNMYYIWGRGKKFETSDVSNTHRNEWESKETRRSYFSEQEHQALEEIAKQHNSRKGECVYQLCSAESLPRASTADSRSGKSSPNSVWLNLPSIIGYEPVWVFPSNYA